MRLFIVIETTADVTPDDVYAFALTMPEGARLTQFRDQITGRDLLTESCAAHVRTGASPVPTLGV